MVSDEVKSRREFIHAMGGQQHIARKLGLKSRQVVDSMITCGFFYKWRERLVEEAIACGIDPHPELFERPRPRYRISPTKLGTFICEIVHHHGGNFREFSRETKIPMSSLRTMCEKNGHVVKVHIPLLESLARECNIPFPENWPNL